MDANPKVSVMIITYNQAHFIRETLDSVLSQDYDNLEIVVADDASTDGTQNILKEYAAKYPDKFVLVLNERNLGITGNSNAAFFACKGELIAILGGDDLFLPGKITAQVKEFVQDSAVVLCYHPVEIFQSSTNKTMYITNQNPREDTNSVEEIIVRGGIPGASSIMIRRSACPPDGFDSRLPTVSDWLFPIEVALEGKVKKADAIYGRYRKHGQGASDRTLELLDESLYALDLAVQKHPEHPELVEFCRKGKARYIAGEAFRQLAKNPRTSNKLWQKAIEFNPKDIRLRFFSAIFRFGFIAILAGKLTVRLKYLIKRYLL